MQLTDGRSARASRPGPELGGLTRVDGEPLDSPRWELATAIVIAIVSLTTALAAWWTSTIASSAADLSRRGLIDAIKVQAGANEDWRQAHEEAASAARFSAYAAEAETLVSSADPAAQARGENLKTTCFQTCSFPSRRWRPIPSMPFQRGL